MEWWNKRMQSWQYRVWEGEIEIKSTCNIFGNHYYCTKVYPFRRISSAYRCIVEIISFQRICLKTSVARSLKKIGMGNRVWTCLRKQSQSLRIWGIAENIEAVVSKPLEYEKIIRHAAMASSSHESSGNLYGYRCLLWPHDHDYFCRGSYHLLNMACSWASTSAPSSKSP